MHQAQTPFYKKEILGSIPGRIKNGAASELNGSIRRVGASTLANWSVPRWEMLARELARKIAAPEHVLDAVVRYRGKHMESMDHLRQREAAAALLFIFSKNNQSSHRSLDEICEVAGADISTARKYMTKFVLDDGLRLVHRMPEEYVAQYGSMMNLGKEVLERGAEIAVLFRKSTFTSISPKVIAAGALYLASRENGKEYTQGEIGKVFGVAEYTVREDSIKMRKALKLR